MTAGVAARAFAVWLGILVLAIANGALREALLIPAFGRTPGLVASGALLSIVIVLAARLSIAWIAPLSAAAAWMVGLTWVLLTLAFEFGFGALVQHKPWDELVAPYLFRDGNIWPLVLVVTLVAPRLAYRG